MIIKRFTLEIAAGLTALSLTLPAAAPAAQDQIGEAETDSAYSETAEEQEVELAPAEPEGEASQAEPEDETAAAEGAAVFAQHCVGCHSAESGQLSYGGPNLAGVVGRPAASARFRYSAALRGSGLTWTEEELDGYIASPMTKVPGSAMAISLPDDELRAKVIAFLATKSESDQSAPQ